MITQLKIKGIGFDKGLTESEIHKIEEIYDIRLPDSLRGFYSLGVPISEGGDGFPQWRNFTEPNIAKIKKRIQAPLDRLWLDVEKGFWLPNWGKRPESIDEVSRQFAEISLKAPRLIPIYSHRYMPQCHDAGDIPIISAVGRDIIYYGGNLHEYLQNEFLDGHFRINKHCKYTPFWSDIINNL